MIYTVRPDQIDTAKTPVLDVRMQPGAKQIRGALHYKPSLMLQGDPLVLPFAKETPVVVYGDSESIVAAVIDKLRKSGYPQVAALEGGIEGWRDAGLPLEDATLDQPVPGVS